MNAMKTVLVIDDETATLTMFRLFLKAHGYAVLTAENGAIGVGIQSIRGPLSAHTKDQLMVSVQRPMASRTKGIVIRFEDYSAVNGDGIALLSRLLSEIRTAGMPVCIAWLLENVTSIFDMLGISRVTPCFDTLGTALAAMHDHDHPLCFGHGFKKQTCDFNFESV